MTIDGMTALVLKELLRTDEPMSTAAIADRIGVSKGSVRGYLKEAGDVVAQAGGSLSVRPGVGIVLDADENAREKLGQVLKIEVDHSYSYQFRKKYILDLLFRGVENYTIQLFADDLYVGKSRITKDLDRIDAWLEAFDVRIRRQRKHGLSLQGRESSIREAMVQHNRFMDRKSIRADEAERPPALNYRVSTRFYKYLTQSYQSVDILKLQSLLCEEERSLGAFYTDMAFRKLVEYLAVALTRQKAGSPIRTQEYAYPSFFL